jgi:CRP/FNR family transcriptional regulator, anaerobic regulatory protein
MSPINIFQRSGAASGESSCSRCYLRRMCLPSRLSGNAIAELDDVVREKRKVERGEALYRRGDPFDSLFAIRSGSFKSVTGTGAGQTKVIGLHLPAELLGLDAISSYVHAYDAIALEDAEVCVIPYRRLTKLASRLPLLLEQLLRLLSEDIARDRGLVLRLAGLPAKRRLAAFLLGLSLRHRKLGFSGTRLRLPMRRKDIASYLGLTVETVCRLFATLERERLIDVHLREVQLKDLSALRELVGY